MEVRGIICWESAPASALEVCLAEQPEVLILDLEPLLLDWRSPAEAEVPDWSAIVTTAARAGVRTLVVLTNSRRDVSNLGWAPPEARDLAVRVIRRAWKPWTARRKLGLDDHALRGVVCGDVALTDGLLAIRLRYGFVHLTVKGPPVYPRMQDLLGRCLLRRYFRTDSTDRL